MKEEYPLKKEEPFERKNFFIGLDGRSYSTLQALYDADERYRRRFEKKEKDSEREELFIGLDGRSYSTLQALIDANRRHLKDTNKRFTF